MNFDYTNINPLWALAGGVVSFFASCFLPMVPTYIAYLTGLNSYKESKKITLLLNSLAFSFGFILIFVVYGFSASKLGNHFAEYRSLGQSLGGLLLILFGLFILGAFKPNILTRNFGYKIDIRPTRFVLINSFLFGMTFGFAWSPCIGPMLGVIIFLASQTKTVIQGSVLLLSYGLGIAVPFVLIALMFDLLWPRLKNVSKYSGIINNTSGVIILLFGILLLTGKVNYFVQQLSGLFKIYLHTF